MIKFISLQNIINQTINEKIEAEQDFSINFYGSNEDVHNIDFSLVKAEILELLIDENYTQIDSIEALTEANQLLQAHQEHEADTWDARDFLPAHQLKARNNGCSPSWAS